MSHTQAALAEPFAKPAFRTAPHWHSREVLGHVSVMIATALVPVALASVCFCGISVLVNVAVVMLTAGLTQLLVRALLNRNIELRNGYSLVMAAVLALTLPPGCAWTLAALGAVLMIMLQELVGGIGHYLWHPLLISRALLIAVAPAAMMPTSYPVLKKEHIVFGHLSVSEPVRVNDSWWRRQGGSAQSWSGPAAISILSSAYTRDDEIPAREALLKLVRDRLPPIGDCVLGTVGSDVGTGSILAVLLGGLFLIYRGYVRWTLPAGAAIGAIMAAAILPLPDGLSGQGWRWWVMVVREPGQPSLPVGMIFVLYHMLAGELLFAVFFIASDMTSSPLRTSGHWWFGVGIGGLTVALRYFGLGLGAAYWAILILNTLVPAIDRITRRRVYGT